MTGRTLYEKIWDDHIVTLREDGTALVYVDRHLLHELSSPQAFEALRLSGRRVRRPDLSLAVPDHNVSTRSRSAPVTDTESLEQLKALTANCQAFDIELIDMHDPRQGIVHVIGPEEGFTLPGATVVCGDSHTATHGAFGALAFGIGASEIEHVLSTQTLLLRQSKTMEVRVEGRLGFSITPKDLALAIVGHIGAGGGNGHVVEFRGPVIEAMSMEGRMTVCNMAIECGGRAGLIAPDEGGFNYLAGRPRSPAGAHWDAALKWWRSLASDPDAVFDKSVTLDAGAIAPMVTWGTSPEDAAAITDTVPAPESFSDPAKQHAVRKSLEYMGLTAGMRLEDIEVQNVFIGSCTNARIEDLRSAAAVARGRHLAGNIRQALVVPGSGAVKRQAEAEGLDLVFIQAGFEWREPGCSMCLAVNGDRVPAGERCASTSNRNFVGRQGPGSRTHLLSPAMAVAAAVTGRLTDVRQLGGGADAAV